MLICICKKQKAIFNSDRVFSKKQGVKAIKMAEINVNFYFNRQDDVNHKIRFHFHKCYEIIYYISGFGYFLMNGVRYEYKDKTCVIIPPNATHNDVRGDDCNVVCIGVSCSDDLLSLPVVTEDINETIFNYINLIRNEFIKKENDYLSVINNLIACILVEIKRLGKTTESLHNKRNDLISQAINYIDEYFLTDITAEQLSEISNYSYDRFRHIFRTVTGMSPKQYITNKRIEHAKFLLSTTDYSVTEVGSLCGFSATTIFIKKFSLLYGTTPYKYYRQMREKSGFTE